MPVRFAASAGPRSENVQRLRPLELEWLRGGKVLPKSSPRQRRMRHRILTVDDPQHEPGGEVVPAGVDEASEQARWKQDGKVVRGTSARRPQVMPNADRNWVSHKAGWLCEAFEGKASGAEVAGHDVGSSNKRGPVMKHHNEVSATPSQRGGVVEQAGQSIRRGEGTERPQERYEWVNENQVRRRRPQTAPSDSSSSLLDQMRPHDAARHIQPRAENASAAHQQGGGLRKMAPAEKLQPALDPEAWVPKRQDGRDPWKPWKMEVPLPKHKHCREAPLQVPRKKREAAAVFRPPSAASKFLVQRSVAMHPNNRKAKF